MAEYKLYGIAQSGNAYKPALMLNLCGADWTPIFVDYFNGETRTPEFRKLNEMGEIPVLDHNGKILTQSGVILDYLARKLGEFGPENEDEQSEILRWLLFDNHKLTGYIGTLRFLIQFAETGETETTDFLRGRMTTSLKTLNRHLANQPFAIGNRPTIADISMCGYLFWPEEFGVSWDDYPQIGDWLERIKALPGWVHPYELLPGYPKE